MTIQEAILATKQAKKEFCLHPQASSVTCNGDIIRAHSIQRNGGLSQIARASHVYMLDTHLTSLIKSQGEQRYSLIGINKATTFTGFCQHHDSLTFRPIEYYPFTPSQESAFLLAYRGICREIYAKRYQTESINLLREGDRGRSKEAQESFQAFVSMYDSGVKAGLTDLDHYKGIYDSKLLAADYTDVSYYVISFDRVPDFMCSSAILLEMDFNGNLLQTPAQFMQLDKRLLQCTFSLVGTDSGGSAIFSWIGKNPHGISFINSLDTYSDDEISHAVVRFTFEFFENIAISPKWWENLKKSDRDQLQKRIEIGLSLTEERSPQCLNDDGLRVVEWKVVAREKKLIH